MNRSPHLRVLLVSAALGAAVALGGCNTNGPLPMSEKAARPLSEKMVSEIESKNMDKDSPILVRVFKQESELEVWKQDRTGRFALLKSYPICRWSGELGPKIKEGDRQAPEGFYTITPGQMNPNSQYYLSFDLGYPNAFDRAHGRTGSQLMVHGDCSSRGCYSMTDEQISEIYALGRDSFFGGQKSFQVQAYPFRMTPQNMARHRNNPHIAFWKMLKRGNDHFEVSRLEPKINVCEKRYVFDAYSPGDPSRSPSFRATDKCPAYEVSEEILAAVNDKQRQDEFQTANLIRRGTPAAPIRMNTDGGMHPVFVAAVKRNELGVAPTAFSLASAPGTVPATVRPPRIAELADTPAMADTFDQHTGSPAPAPAPRAAPVRSASAESAAPPANRSSGLFGNLFAGNSENTERQGTPIDRMARLIGLRGSDPEPAAAAPVPAPRPRPAVRQANAAPAAPASNGAIRPRQTAAEPERTPPRPPAAVASAWPAPAAPAQQQPQAQNQTQAQNQAQAPANGSLRGAAPVVPTGSFENRWSAFR